MLKIDNVVEKDGAKGKFYVVKIDGKEYLNFDEEIMSKVGQEIDGETYSKNGRDYLKFKKSSWNKTFVKADKNKELAFNGALTVALALVKKDGENPQDEIIYTVESMYENFTRILKKEAV